MMYTIINSFYIEDYEDYFTEDEVEQLICAGVKIKKNKMTFVPGIKGTYYRYGGAEGLNINGVEVDIYDVAEYVK